MSIDGSTGAIYAGIVKIVSTRPAELIDKVLAWSAQSQRPDTHGKRTRSTAGSLSSSAWIPLLRRL